MLFTVQYQEQNMTNRAENRSGLRNLSILATATVVSIALLACSIWNGDSGGTKPPQPTPTPTSVLQSYFDVMEEYGKTHGGECQVNPDCLSPNVCYVQPINGIDYGTCALPGQPPTNVTPVPYSP